MNRKFYFVSIIVAVFLCFAFYPSTALAVGELDSDINELLAPYRVVMQAVGSEFGYSPRIPEGEEVNVYNNLKNYTLEEFEKTLREQYIDALAAPERIIAKVSGNGKILEQTEIYRDGSITYYKDEENAIDITPNRAPASRRYERENISGNTLYHVFVDVKILINPPCFDSLVGSGYFSSMTLNYFKTTNFTYSFNSGSTELYGTHKGTILTPSGLDLLVATTLNYTYFPD